MNLRQLRTHRDHLVKIHDETLVAINTQITEAVRKRKVTCTTCSFRGTISDWTYIQTFFMNPAAHPEDDDWIAQPPENCHVECPNCSTITVVKDHLYHTEFTESATEKDIPVEKLFKKVLATYGESAPEPLEPEW